MDTYRFAEWLREELERQGMSQADLVRGSGLSIAQISRIINHRSEPSKDALNAIAHGLRLPANEVFQAAGILPPSPELTPLMERAIFYLSELLPEDQERVVLYLEVLHSRYKRDKIRP